MSDLTPQRMPIEKQAHVMLTCQADKSCWVFICTIWQAEEVKTTADRYFSVWLELLLAPLFVLLHMLIRRAVEASTRKILAAASQNVKRE